MARVTSVVGHNRSSISELTRGFHLAPGAVGKAEADALAGAALAAHHLADPLELLGHALVGGDDLVEGVGDLAEDADAVAGHAHGEVADPHGLQRVKEFREAAGIDLGVAVDVMVGRWGWQEGRNRWRVRSQ